MGRKGRDLRLVERFETKVPWGASAPEKQRFLNRSKRRRRFVRAATVASALAFVGLGWVANLQFQRFEDKRFLRETGYPQELYEWQHKLKKLALTEPLDLERFTWLSSDAIEELELKATSSSNSAAGLVSLSRCHSLKKLILDLRDSQVSDLEPLAKLSKLTQLSLDLRGSKVSNFGQIAKLGKLTQSRSGSPVTR